MKTLWLYFAVIALNLFMNLSSLGWFAILFAIPFWLMVWDLCEYATTGKTTYLPLVRKLFGKKETQGDK